MSFYSLPTEIHWQIIRIVCRDAWGLKGIAWAPLSLVCPLWRELAQGIPRSKNYYFTSDGSRSVPPKDLEYLQRSLVNNPKIWPTGEELRLKVDTVEDIQMFWKWLSGVSTDLVKSITLRIMPWERTRLVLTGLRELPTTNLLGLYLWAPACIDNASLSALLKSCPNLTKVYNFNLREPRPRDEILGQQNSLADAYAVISYLQTKTITSLDLTLQRIQLVDGHEKEPCVPYRENSAAFFTALMALSTQLRNFAFRGRCPRDLFRLGGPDCSWPHLEVMTIEFDIVDPNGRFWVNCIGSPERNSDVGRNYRRPASPVEEENEAYYVNMASPRGEKCDLWDQFLADAARQIPAMPKLKFLAVGCNRDIIVPCIPVDYSWQFWGLVFLPNFPVGLELNQVMDLPPKTCIHQQSDLELKILHMKEYTPSNSLLRDLENKHGRVTTTKWENLEVISEVTWE